jgi:hypothetical protein
MPSLKRHKPRKGVGVTRLTSMRVPTEGSDSQRVLAKAIREALFQLEDIPILQDVELALASFLQRAHVLEVNDVIEK